MPKKKKSAKDKKGKSESQAEYLKPSVLENKSLDSSLNDTFDSSELDSTRTSISSYEADHKHENGKTKKVSKRFSFGKKKRPTSMLAAKDSSNHLTPSESRFLSASLTNLDTSSMISNPDMDDWRISGLLGTVESASPLTSSIDFSHQNGKITSNETVSTSPNKSEPLTDLKGSKSKENVELQLPSTSAEVEALDFSEAETSEKTPSPVPSSLVNEQEQSQQVEFHTSGHSEFQQEDPVIDTLESSESKQEEPVILESESFTEAATDFEYAANLHDELSEPEKVEEDHIVEVNPSDIIERPPDISFDESKQEEETDGGCREDCCESKTEKAEVTEIAMDTTNDPEVEDHTDADPQVNGDVDHDKSSENISVDDDHEDVDLIIVRNLDDIVDASQIEMPNGFPVDEYLVINFAKDEWVYVTQKEKEGRIMLDDRSMDAVELDL